MVCLFGWILGRIKKKEKKNRKWEGKENFGVFGLVYLWMEN